MPYVACLIVSNRSLVRACLGTRWIFGSTIWMFHVCIQIQIFADSKCQQYGVNEKQNFSNSAKWIECNSVMWNEDFVFVGENCGRRRNSTKRKISRWPSRWRGKSIGRSWKRGWIRRANLWCIRHLIRSWRCRPGCKRRCCQSWAGRQSLPGY